MNRFDCSVVVPVYLGGATVGKLAERVFKALDGMGMTGQLVLVDDASPDGSWQMVSSIAERYPGRVVSVRLARNAGQQSATLCGLHQAAGDWVVTMDDDLQHLPEELPKLFDRQRQTGADLVYGVFADKHHSLLRNIGSKVFNRLFGSLASTSGNGSSFRLIKGSVCRGLLRTYHRNLLLDEVLSWNSGSVAHATVTHGKREEGESGYSLSKLVMLTLSYIVNYTVLPLRLMTLAGLVSSFVMLVIGCYFIYQKLCCDVSLGFTSLIVAVFFCASLMLFCLGIIGEYVSRIYVKDFARPQYLVAELRGSDGKDGAAG